MTNPTSGRVSQRSPEENGEPRTSSPALRICHLGKYYPPSPGGIETHVRTLARAQVRLGHKVEVLCMQHGSEKTIVEADEAIRVTRFAPSASIKKLELSWALVKALRHVQADILHLQVPNPTMILALLAARPDIPLVVTYQSDVVRQRVLGACFFNRSSRLLYRRVRRIVHRHKRVSPRAPSF